MTKPAALYLHFVNFIFINFIYRFAHETQALHAPQMKPAALLLPTSVSILFPRGSISPIFAQLPALSGIRYTYMRNLTLNRIIWVS